MCPDPARRALDLAILSLRCWTRGRRRWPLAVVFLRLLPPFLLREWAAVHLLRRALLLLLARLGLVLVLVRRLGPSRGRRVGRPVRPLGAPYSGEG